LSVSFFDYFIFFLTILFIVFYGVWKNKKQNTIDSYLRGSRNSPWWVIFLSIAATQASAITFLSTPGQGFSDGLGFIQFYFGLPFAVIIVAYVIAPKFIGAEVYTAYEYLEKKFDLKTRQLTAFYFLIQRGMAAGLTIYAPAIVFSLVLGISLNTIIFILGGLVTFYTLLGGSKAVNQTQSFQMAVIFLGMFFVFFYIIFSMPAEVSLLDIYKIANISSKTKVLDFSFDTTTRYTVWSGLTGGFFLALSYFGTDQSQVQRYLSAKSIKDSRKGLIANAIFKIPMQFFILSIGVLLFVFYQFEKPPLFFNNTELSNLKYSSLDKKVEEIEFKQESIFNEKKKIISNYLSDSDLELIEPIQNLYKEELLLKDQFKELLNLENPNAETNDKDFIFITFILTYLPAGFIGLLLASFASASMSSTASELSALASTTIIDFYKRSICPDKSELHYVHASKYATFFWGIVAMSFAVIASLFENLIQAVNIVGSLFYGTILGVFILAFLDRKIKGTSVFFAALFSEILVIVLYLNFNIGFLWFNLIGTFLVMTFALTFNLKIFKLKS
jgi:SSS family solute:Na+ symporter